LFTKENRTIKPNQTKLLITNRTELFQFDFKTVGYDSIFFFSIFLVQFNLVLHFGLVFWLFCHPCKLAAGSHAHKSVNEIHSTTINKNNHITSIVIVIATQNVLYWKREPCYNQESHENLQNVFFLSFINFVKILI
jgi:hypothetical protein